MQRDQLRRVAGRHRQSRAAAFQRRDAFFQHRIGGVHDARIDVAEDLKIEQRRRMIGVLEHEAVV